MTDKRFEAVRQVFGKRGAPVGRSTELAEQFCDAFDAAMLTTDKSLWDAIDDLRERLAALESMQGAEQGAGDRVIGLGCNTARGNATDAPALPTDTPRERAFAEANRRYRMNPQLHGSDEASVVIARQAFIAGADYFVGEMTKSSAATEEECVRAGCDAGFPGKKCVYPNCSCPIGAAIKAALAKREGRT